MMRVRLPFDLPHRDRSRRFLLFLALLIAASAPATISGGPLSPAESMARMELEAGFKIELFAAEPDIVDPVDMAFDEQGRAFVAEMREMEALPALEPGTLATIRMLEDLDGDGMIDRSVLFAEGLSFPSGLAAFEGGLYALCTPDLLYLKDTDGDGRADLKRVILTGFSQGNAEHRFNNLTWGIDNWIYAANGAQGGKVYDPADRDAAPIDLRNRDFRFHPWTGRFEGITRQLPGGFGLTFDDWGRRFVCHNEIHVMHVVLPERYLKRNRYMPVRRAGGDISDHGRPDAKVYPISDPQAWRIERTTLRAETLADRYRKTQLQPNGYFTAACGVTVYRAGLFPRAYYGNLFVCDAAGNLIHRDLLSDDGSTVRASRANEATEFLRSSDPWFRPVNLEVGPDGAIYVLDFYREIIETGVSIPEDILAKIDLRAGSDRGRIYRITPKSKPERGGAVTNLSQANDTELLAMLGRPGAWQRLTAQRLILERDSKALAEELRSLAREGADPRARLHALWTLEGLGELDAPTVAAALGDPHPRLREHALRLSEPFLAPASQ